MIARNWSIFLTSDFFINVVLYWMGILCKYQIYNTIPSYNKTWLKKSKVKWKKQISGHVFFGFFWLNEIAHFLWVSSFALALVWTFNTRGVYNFITKQTNISVNLAPFFNDVSFLFCCFLKSRVTNELKSLFLWKSKKELFIPNRAKTLLLIKRKFGQHIMYGDRYSYNFFKKE